MLIKAKTLEGYKLNSLDGEIGKVDEFYFDDHHWTVRYLIAETGGWLTGRQVLISPYSLTVVNTEEHYILTNLTQKKIEDSPPLESDIPVSQQYEESYYKYYEQPVYWGGPFIWGDSPFIENCLNLREYEDAPTKEDRENDDNRTGSWDPNLRRMNIVRGYTIRGTDGDIGRIDDFVIDDETWAIRYLIINTSTWWSGKKVLISPKWIERIDWPDSIAYVNVVRDDIMRSPEYSEDLLLTREYEASLHQHYNRKGYWVDEPKNSNAENRK